MKKKTIFTIGHSNRTLEYFFDLLRAYKIETILDIRTIPRSRHNPQFNQKELQLEKKTFILISN